jgi:colanic acid biosynthesis glycosyl transferase WcaI
MADEKENLNILWMMLYWYPYEGPLQPVYGAILKDLMAKGHNVTIVSSFPHFRKGRPETWDEFRGKLFQKTQWEGAKLIRSYVYAPVFKQSKPGLFYRALNFISFNFSCVIAGIFMAGKADIIFAPSSPPLTNGITAWIVSLFKRCPVIYNVMDMYPDMAEKTGIIKSRFLIRLLKIMEKAVYKLSGKVLLLSEGMRSNVIAKGVPREKTEVIPNFFDVNFLKPLEADEENPFAAEWNPQNRFMAVYGGNVGIPHGAEVIVEAAEKLKDNPGIMFSFVGRGEYRPTLQKMAEEKKLGNLLFIPARQFAHMPLVWSAASVSLITYKKGLSEDSLPTKLIASMCCRRPVVAAVDEDSDTAKLIDKAGCGIIVPPEDAEAFAGAVLSLSGDHRLRQKMGKAGRDYVLVHFKREVISERYEELLLSVALAKKKRKNAGEKETHRTYREDK